jgi:hypothetical protein
MKTKAYVSGIVLLVVLSGCGNRTRDPQPSVTQTTTLSQLSSSLNDLEAFQTNQDDLSDDELLGE